MPDNPRAWSDASRWGAPVSVTARTDTGTPWSTRSCSRPPAAHSSSCGCATTTTSRRQSGIRSGRSGAPGPGPATEAAASHGSHLLADVVVTCLPRGPGPRLARHPGAAELLDDRRAEGRQVRGGPAGDELPVDDDLLVDDLGAGAAQVGPQARPGGEPVAADDVGLEQCPRAVAD